MKLVKPVLCPACGHRMRKGYVQIGDIRCPGCGEYLERDTRYDWLVTLLSLFLGFVIAYLAGLTGMVFFVAAVILSFVLACVAGFVATFLRPRLVRRAQVDGVDFRITGPPGPRRKEGGE